ncbi:MAG: carboxymuconolactone decarboxylase family protein [Planctomycetota bacterium]|jgi:alkylhydroperoxidase/carboxymuconolactone decarboxylase family protein YurZ
MPLTKRLEAATISFLLTGLDPLGRHDAMLAICSALAADGHSEHSKRIFEALLKEEDGPEPEHLREAILQTHLFGGYPRALNTLAAFKAAAAKVSNPLSGEINLRQEPLEGDDLELFRQRGKELFDSIYTDSADKVDKFATSSSPDLADWAIAVGYGRVLSRPVLEPRQRSLCICASLIPLDVSPQLKGHIKGAKNTGSTTEQLWRLFDLVVKLFKEGPETRSAKASFEDVLGKRKMDIDFDEEREMRW